MTFVLSKIDKLLPPELHFLTPIGTKSFVGWGFAPDLIAVLWGLLLKGRGGREFVLCLGKKKEKLAPMVHVDVL